jgi:L-threonylcarbamoyladenylate synthase
LLGYPTETVYGFGAAVSPEGVASLRRLKGRKEDKPFLVLLPDVGEESAGGLELPAHARRLAWRYWPGPLTLVLSDPSGLYPEGVRSSEGGVAVRLSSHPFVEALLGVYGRALISTSANTAGSRPALSVQDVRRAVNGRTGLHPFLIVDGGELIPSPPSTIVDCTRSVPRIVRGGTLSSKDLVELTGNLR